MSYLSRHTAAQEAFESSCTEIIHAYQTLLANCDDEIDEDRAKEMSDKFEALPGTDKVLVLASILDDYARGEPLVSIIERYLGMSSREYLS